MIKKPLKMIFLNLIFELYHDRNDTRLHSIYFNYDIKSYLKLLNYE